MGWQADICGRCNTTHAQNEAGDRVCPKPPRVAEAKNYHPNRSPFADIGFSMDAFPTRTLGGPGTGVPKWEGNGGTSAPTTADLGLTPEQCKSIGV